ncbi:hypothetical protein MKW94_027756 [Papaver nudicaule]|uniref:Uncharacterized protein n=1 Tax=Papaver nudicaule TaxID=74823 RepID=A0AA42B5A2_PAPNU|nr:hypothetical protein [Papaver nudicaule]
MPLLAGMSVEAAALCSRWCIQAWQAFKTRPIIPWTRRFYEGGFQPVMTRREAALILCVRIAKKHTIANSGCLAYFTHNFVQQASAYLCTQTYNTVRNLFENESGNLLAMGRESCAENKQMTP